MDLDRSASMRSTNTPTVSFQVGRGIEPITHLFSKRTNLLSMGLVKFENAMLAVCIRFSFTICLDNPYIIVDLILEEVMAKLIAVLILIFTLSCCTTSQKIVRPNDNVEYLIACGASLGWNICYDKANQLCPGGYSTLSEDAGFNRKELRIGCPSAAKHTQ